MTSYQFVIIREWGALFFLYNLNDVMMSGMLYGIL